MMAATSAPKRGRRGRFPAIAPADLGPRIRRDRGEVAVVDRPEPGNPNRTVRGASLVVIYHSLWAVGVLTAAQHEAADRYLVAAETIEGASLGRAEVSGNVPNWAKGHPTMRQVQAAADLRAAGDLFGPGLSAWIRCVVCQNVWPHGTPNVPRLSTALDRLATMWRIQ